MPSLHEANELYELGGENVLRGLELFDREKAHLEAAFEYLIACLPKAGNLRGTQYQSLMQKLLKEIEGKWPNG
jgi:hypothetical protein